MLRYLITASIITFLGLAPARADFVVAIQSEVTQFNLQYFYKYTITNLHNSTLNVIAFSLVVDESADLDNIVVPEHWTITYTPGSALLSAESSDSSTDIVPGGIGVISFFSHLAPVKKVYAIDGADQSFTDFDAISGFIDGPGVSIIPEPASIIPFGTGLVAFAGFAWRRRVSYDA